MVVASRVTSAISTVAAQSKNRSSAILAAKTSVAAYTVLSSSLVTWVQPTSS
jgi:hypothetical protein